MFNQREKILRDLISISSYYPNISGLEECKNYIEKILRNIKIANSSVEVIDGNIIFFIDSKESERTMGILLHYDTIPPIGGSPKSFSKDSEAVFGLGVTSAKGAIAAVLANLIKNQDTVSKNKIRIIFSCDESIGSIRGTRNLIDNYPEKIDADIYWIPDCANSYISIGSYHVSTLKVNFVGLGGHPAYTRITDEENVMSVIPKIIDLLKKEFDRIKDIYLKKEYQPVLSITGIRAFSQPNIIPDKLEVFLDLRIPPDIEKDAIVDGLLSMLRKMPFYKDAQLEYYPGFMSQINLKVVDGFIKNIESMFNKKLEKKIEYGSHDGAYYGYKLKKPVIGFLPGGCSLHTDNEYLKTGSLDAVEKLFQKITYDL